MAREGLYLWEGFYFRKTPPDRCRPPANRLNEPDAPVAQLDRALPSEGKGHTFESCRVRQQSQKPLILWINSIVQ
jgi:hypothetical protein